MSRESFEVTAPLPAARSTRRPRGRWTTRVAIACFTAALLIGDESRGGPIVLANSYAQDFNTLSSTPGTEDWEDDSTIDGWFSNQATYRVQDSGTGLAGLHSFGTAGSEDRALGSIASSTLREVIFGAQFQNGTGGVIKALKISYVGEQWWDQNTDDQRLEFQFGDTAIALVSPGYEDVDQLDFTSRQALNGGRLNGNQAANRVLITYVLKDLFILNDATFWIRWRDPDSDRSDHGLGIDDFRIQVVPEPSTMTMLFGATLTLGGLAVIRNRKPPATPQPRC